MTAPTASPVAGMLQKHWIKEQTTFDTIVAYAATDAVEGRVGAFKIDGEKNFEELMEAVGTASHQGDVALDRGGKFSIQTNIKPAAAGTAPDIGPAGLKACFGAEGIVGSTSVTYTFSDTVKVPLQGALNIASGLQHVFSGGVVTDWEIDIPGNGVPTITINGEFARFGWAYRDVIGVGGVATSATSCPLDNDSRGCVYPGAVVMLGDDSGTASAGYTVTGYTDTTGSAAFAFSPGLAGAGEAAGLLITPLVPSSTVGGTAIAAVNCGLTIDSVPLGFIKANIKGTTGWGLRSGEATTDRASGIVRVGKRKVEGSLDFWFLDANTGNAPILGRTWEGTIRDIALRVGENTTGKRMTIDINKARLMVPTFDIGEAAVQASVSFLAQQNAAAADECIVSFT